MASPELSTSDLSVCFTCTHEVQECFEGQGEADLHTHWTSCPKNPGHTGFIPAKKFSIEDLPSGCRDEAIFDVAKCLIDLTVRITVKFTSPDRPEFVPDTKDPYPFYSSRGKRLLRTGSGRVWLATKYSEDMNKTEPPYRTCPCPECEVSGTPSKVWWRVIVGTAKHVVFDTSEARQSSCRLWFDDDSSPTINLTGWQVDDTSEAEKDFCRLFYVTHDMEIGTQLQQMVGRFLGQRLYVEEKYESEKHDLKLVILVSHPHGCSKQVSVGHWVLTQEVGDHTRYTYTACTCPGSSGAMVYRLGWWADHPHSGANAGGLNVSGLKYDADL